MLAASQPGELLEAELFPLSGQGRLRRRDINISNGYAVRIKCDPNDQSPCVWIFYKEDTPGLFALFQSDGGIMNVGFESEDLMIVSFPSGSGRMTVDAEMTNDFGWVAYGLASSPRSDPRASLWFMAVQRVIQPGLQISLRGDIGEADIRRAYAARGLAAADDEIAHMVRQVAPA
jgi:hypothetical protein